MPNHGMIYGSTPRRGERPYPWETQKMNADRAHIADGRVVPYEEELQELRNKLYGRGTDHEAARDRAWKIRLIVTGEAYYSYDDRNSFDSRKPMDYLDEETYKKLPENIRGQLLVQARARKAQYSKLNRGRGATARSVNTWMADIGELDARIELAAKYKGLGMPSEVQDLLRGTIKDTIKRITKEVEDGAIYAKEADEAHVGEQSYRRWYLESLRDTYPAATDADLIEAATKALAEMDAADASKDTEA